MSKLYILTYVIIIDSFCVIWVKMFQEFIHNQKVRVLCGDWILSLVMRFSLDLSSLKESNRK